MTRQLQSAPSIYTIFLSLLFCSNLNNLCACPLPSNASCNECDVLRHIHLSPSRQLTIDLSVEINLALSANTAIEFARNINSENNEDYSFDSTPLEDSATTCYETNAEIGSGSACTNYVEMTGEDDRLPTCRWNYTCDYSPHRFPQYIWRAECDTPPSGYRAQPIYYDIPILTLKPDSDSGCLPFQEPQAVYSWGLEQVQVACSCIPTSS